MAGLVRWPGLTGFERIEIRVWVAGEAGQGEVAPWGALLVRAAVQGLPVSLQEN